jgi:hypothetical protein
MDGALTEMALKILSGMIFIPRGGTRQGSVEINFNPFELANASNAAFELRKRREIGANGRFVESPASIVAARQFDVLTGAGGTDFRGQISDTVTRDSITISWDAPAGRVDQEEIPFLVVGEVPEGVAVALPPRPDVSLPDDRLPDSLRRTRSSGRERKPRVSKKER